MRLWRDIKDARNFDEGEIYFHKLVELVKLEKPDRSFVETIISHFFFFQKIRHFYTTNAVESINSGIERMRNDLGGYFASVRSLEVNLFIQFCNLHDLWSRKPIPAVRANIYELNQLFDLRYGSME
jgi:putative transposase